MASRFGRRGALNLTKLLPVVGGPIGAGADAMSARTIATYADVTFARTRAQSSRWSDRVTVARVMWLVVRMWVSP